MGIKQTEDGSTLHVRMFGNLEIEVKTKILDEEIIRSEMVSKLLSYLLCYRHKKITIQELGDALWQEDQSDNPAGALKNLMYRLRMILKKQWGDNEYILTGRGTYYWNPDLRMEVDTEEFERLCKAANRTCKEEEKITLLGRAIKRYRGMFLSKLAGEYWAASLATYYHSMFLSAVKEITLILEKEREYDKMAQVCQYAIGQDALDEELHCGLIKALIGQNKQNLAVEHYQKTVDLLYENLGIRPSEELRRTYEELLKLKHAQELDLDRIQAELKSDDHVNGAFLCEYGIFKKSYHLEVRRSGRLDIPIYLSLITLYSDVSTGNDGDRYLKFINEAMDAMQKVLLYSLRTGDVISRYSGNQFIVMLPTCMESSVHMIMERIQQSYYSSDKKGKIKVQYSIDEIDYSMENAAKDI